MKTRILGSLVVIGLGSAGHATSFYGNDWVFSYSSVVNIHLNSTFGGGTITETPGAVNDPIVVTQTSLNEFIFDYAIAGIDGFGDFTVSDGPNGQIVTDVNAPRLTGPIQVSWITARFEVPEFTVTGLVNGVAIGNMGLFGDRAYYISGDVMSITDIGVQAYVGGNTWIPAGTAEVHLNSWNMQRPVPEPATMLGLGVGLIGLLKRRKRAK